MALFCSTVPHTQGAQARITQFYLQLHQCLSLPRKRSPDGASTDWDCGHLIAAYSSKGWKDERLSRSGWLTYSGRFIHISGHPSTAGRAQDRVVRRSKTDVLPLYHAATLEKRSRDVWKYFFFAFFSEDIFMYRPSHKSASQNFSFLSSSEKTEMVVN